MRALTQGYGVHSVLARKTALSAAIAELAHDSSAAALRLKGEYESLLADTEQGFVPHHSSDNALRLRVLIHSQRAIHELRARGNIGDAAYRIVEQQFDLLDFSAWPAVHE